MTRKRGRPPLKKIDFDELDKLCAIQATGEECASWFDIDYDTLNAICKREKDLSFSDYFKQKRGKGKVSLRRKQFQTAMDGNATMLVWLGKNWLEQSDTVTFDGGVSISQFRVVSDDE